MKRLQNLILKWLIKNNFRELDTNLQLHIDDFLFRFPDDRITQGVLILISDEYLPLE